MDVYFNALQRVLTESGLKDFSVREAESPGTNYQVICTIGLTGEMKGYLILRSDLESARSFAVSLASALGISAEDAIANAFGDFHKEIISEITNQIAGRAIMLLSDTGYDCNITPPTMIIGNDVFTDLINFGHFFSYSIIGTFGKLALFVALKTEKF